MEPKLEYAKERVRVLEKILKDVIEGVPVDCSKGCAYCCYGVTLWIKEPEAVLLVDYLNSLPLKERKEIAKRLKKYGRIYQEEARRVGYLPSSPIPEERLDVDRLGLIGGLGMNEVPCPFLKEDKSCSVYEARPGMCRLTLFRDKEVCRRDWENPLGFVWKNEIAPFIEEIRGRFYARWKLALVELGRRFPELDTESLEERVGFITYWLRFDPVKKVFKLKA
ncbi:MAG: hypothetical protein GXO18_00095 [Aquificae bacterium]|nr:hypothetical protein [Aquificota bacterium]